MTSNQYVPVIVGVGDVVNRSLKTTDAVEPMQLMLQAIHIAIDDTRSSTNVKRAIDSIDVVACWTWPYDDLPGLLGEKLRVKLKQKFMPNTHGGNQPAKLLDEAARRISQGQCEVAVVCGGEALASLGSFARAGKLPPPGWTKTSQQVNSVFAPSVQDLATGIAAPHQIGAPIHIYPLYENGLRAHRGQSIEDNKTESAELYAQFAEVAERNPYSWNFGKHPESKASLMEVSSKNRMICYPYPLLMNAFNNVNLAAACIVTSTTMAERLGVPKESWIYPLGGAGTRDSYDFWERPNFFSSPSISRSIDASLQASGLTKDDVDVYDFYSCFPIVPKIACQHLGLSITKPEKPITLLGGLTSFGGAGNNYSMHALTEMVRKLRKGDANIGLVLANGGMMTYQHALCLSSHPRKDSSNYPQNPPISDVVTDVEVPLVMEEPKGEAIIETYTVEFNRHGSPVRGHVVGRIRETGFRFIANHGDESTLQQLSSHSHEPIGRIGTVSRDHKVQGRNLFTLKASTKL